MRSNLLNEINTALYSLPAANLSSASAGNDLYEVYVWALALRAARNEGGVISFHDSSGATPGSFWFRTSPSSIFSKAHDYSFAIIRFANCPELEAHSGIYVAGKSQVAHECDVAVLYKAEADFCRRTSVHPRSSKVVLSAECKFYVDSAIGINLGRSFMGLISDIYTADRFFIGTRNSASVAKLFSKHKKEYELGLSPLAIRLEARLVSSFEKTFRDFISREQ